MRDRSVADKDQGVVLDLLPACKTMIEAEFLGGAKGIHKFEVWIMHQYYLRKYSKENSVNR